MLHPAVPSSPCSSVRTPCVQWGSPPAFLRAADRPAQSCVGLDRGHSHVALLPLAYLSGHSGLCCSSDPLAYADARKAPRVAPPTPMATSFTYSRLPLRCFLTVRPSLAAGQTQPCRPGSPAYSTVFCPGALLTWSVCVFLLIFYLLPGRTVNARRAGALSHPLQNLPTPKKGAWHIVGV